MKQKTPTITVALPAYNEAINIGKLLEALLQQEKNKFTIKKIIVYSDGSTDKTVDIVRKKMQKFPIIQLIEGKTQKGKFYRLNQIYRDNTSDVLIILDADIGVVGKKFLESFAETIIADPKAQMVAAHQIPLRPHDFIGKVVTSSFTLWDYIRLSVPNCDHVQNLYGAATAYRGSFAKTLHIPETATEDRLYLYLMAKKMNGFRYTYDAQIIYWPVTTISDLMKLSQRAFGRPQPEIDKMFGYKTNSLYMIPRKYKIKGILKALYNDPFYTPLGMFLGIILSRLTTSRKTKDTALWEIALSSKKNIYV
ncbi:MAG TPA: glycosyltransferase [Candidatus Saccharimonadales bacterium]|nr:glycosyltransferase [Candidatus Saccharimonadales bacterium]